MAIKEKDLRLEVMAKKRMFHSFCCCSDQCHQLCLAWKLECIRELGVRMGEVLSNKVESRPRRHLVGRDLELLGRKMLVSLMG
jgi:hypothetical protein